MFGVLHQQKGKFILFEGLSGSGKSTQAQLLYDRLVKDATHDVILNREPSQGIFGRMIRALIERQQVRAEWVLEAKQHLTEGNLSVFYPVLQKIGQGEPLEEKERQQLFVLDRLEDIRQTIFPVLAAQKIVVQDRFNLSTHAYYSAAHPGQAAMEYIIQLHKQILGSAYLLPDLVFVFDLPAEHAVARLEFSGKTIDIYEQGEYLKRVREAYAFLAEQLSQRTNVVVLDGMRGKDALHKEIVEIVHMHLSRGDV
ncbi:MAG: hypothetical protein HZA36_02100 [Parcubacteria group bacterium]|nr:hypothetical protein [Parcubacteria group bacterium]